MRAKSFFYVSLGILALALAYHFGANTATAQAPGNPVVTLASDTNNNFMAVTSNGDAHVTTDYGRTWAVYGNVFSGPTPAAQPTFGQVKAQYRK
jgi:hypothetical protein